MATPNPMFSVPKRLQFWLAPLLMVSIATYQTIGSSLGSLTRWKGGGFGMFSTLDSPDARFLKAYLISDNGEMPVSIPSEFSRDVLLLQTWPRQIPLEALARELANRSWLNSGNPRQSLQSEVNKARFAPVLSAQTHPSIIIATTQPDVFPSSFERLHVNGVRIEVWKTRLDSSGTILNSYCLMTATATLSPATRP